MKPDQKIKPICAALLIFFLFFLLPFSALADEVLNIKMPIPKDDPRWQVVKKMWVNHWDGKNIDDMITICQQLETDFPNRIEPALWMGRLYYIKGQVQMNKRALYHKKAESYAVKAHQIDPNNFCAFFILIHAISNRTDKKAVFQELEVGKNPHCPVCANL